MIEWNRKGRNDYGNQVITWYESEYKGEGVQKRLTTHYKDQQPTYSEAIYQWGYIDFNSESDMKKAINKYLYKNVVWKTALDADIDTDVKNETEEEYTTKADNGKPRLDLVPTSLIWAVGKVMTYGITKYYEESWRTVDPKRYKAALLRHLMLYLEEPESKDEESGLYHLSHIACNVAFLIELENIKESKE